MSYYSFAKDDIIDIVLDTYPKHTVEFNGTDNKGYAVTGSIELDREYLRDPEDNEVLRTRTYTGFSQKRGGLTTTDGPFTASINIKTATSGSTNNELWFSLSGTLYPFYRVVNADYEMYYNNSLATTVRVIDIPSIYYDKEILTGSFSASDKDSAGDDRKIYDNGRGGLYSGSLTGTLVGNIFYQEGLAVLTKDDLSNFGSDSSTNFKWKVDLKGVHRIPIKIFNCRAPAGELNCSTNPTFYQEPTTGDYKNEKEIVMNPKNTYITTVGLYNENFELVAMAKLAQPIKKTIQDNINIRLKIDH